MAIINVSTLQSLTSETPIQDQIEAAQNEARRTGRRQTLLFDKQKLFEENHDAAADPRMQFISGDLVRIDFDVNEEITVGELRKICRESKSALAKQKLLSVIGQPDTSSVVLLKQDVMDIREGHSIAMVHGVGGSDLTIPTNALPGGTIPFAPTPLTPTPTPVPTSKETAAAPRNFLP